MITPEIHIFGLVCAMLGLAYFGIFPRMARKTLRRMVQIDLILGLAMLTIAGSAYFGSGVRFNFILIELPWWAFTLLLASIIETPLFLSLCRKWDIDITGGDDKQD